MAPDFQSNLSSPESASSIPASEEEIKQDLESGLEETYSEALKGVRAKNSKKLIKLDMLEKERIANYIKTCYMENKDNHNKKCDDIDYYDDIYRMKPGTTSSSEDGDSPNYTTPLTTVVLEVIHANIMNTFFTPSKLMRVLPTEEGDIPKVNKLEIFGNWSVKNELEIFENCDRLFHSSEKNGECPYIVHWVKEYGTEIKIEIIPNPLSPSEPLLDEEGEPLTQEREVTKLLYNGPKLEIFSRKDYVLPSTAVADRKPDWEIRIVRLSADKVKRREEEGKYYSGTFDAIGDWGGSYTTENNTISAKDGQEVSMGTSDKLFLEFYGRMRIQQIKNDKESDEDSFDELEDEFIGMIEFDSETLCYLKQNRFPLKERPIGLDVFIPDDEGRLEGVGVVEFMEGIQICYDALYNQYIFGVIQANNPFGLFTPTGNMRDEPIKIKSGYLFPTSDPSAINIVKIPPPDQSILLIMEEGRNQAQLLFGISDYAAGVESKIDPTAPAKKAEIVVAQGSTRMNLILRRKNKTLKDIFRRWYLLYKENMPKNKFIRIAGSGEQPFKFESITLSDFALNSLPDFELTGNVLSLNKALDAQKKASIYDQLITNPFFSAQSQQGMKSLHALTKWFIDGMDDLGLSSFLPEVPGENVHTPEEENARFIQGDTGEPAQGEDHVYHIKIHSSMLSDPTLPPEILVEVKSHIQKHIDMLKTQITMQLAISQQGGQGGAIPSNGVGRTIQPAGMAMGAGNPGQGV